TSKMAMAFLIIRSFVSTAVHRPLSRILLSARLHCKSHGHSRLRLVLSPQSALLFSRLTLQPAKLFHPRERKLSVSVTVTLLYNLGIQQGAVFQKDISQCASAAVFLRSYRVRLVEF